VVQPFRTERFAPYAAPAYVARHGLPGSADDFGAHWFVAHDDATHRAPANLWLRARVDAGRIAFRTSDALVMARAVALGAGIGFLPVDAAASDLVQVLPPEPEWEAPLWLVTHVALHRTAKVQALLTYLKAAADRDG
jgi:DNA-binding transcriptional LysR family regulator